MKVHNSDCVAISYDQIREVMGDKPYHMSISRPEADWVIKAVNQGIDAHLEACYIPDRGDSYEAGFREFGSHKIGGYLDCVVSPESLPVLLRRLEELDAETEWDNASGSPSCLVDTILMTLGFNDNGEFTGRDDE